LKGQPGESGHRAIVDLRFSIADCRWTIRDLVIFDLPNCESRFSLGDFRFEILGLAFRCRSARNFALAGAEAKN
jgi:hypothetical protein